MQSMPHGSTAAPCAALSNARLDALSGGQRRMEVFDWMGERMLMSAVACCGIVAARGTWNRDLTQDSDGSSLPCARGDLVAAAGEWERRRLGVAIKPSQASGNATGTVFTRESLICNKLATHRHTDTRAHGLSPFNWGRAVGVGMDWVTNISALPVPRPDKPTPSVGVPALWESTRPAARFGRWTRDLQFKPSCGDRRVGPGFAHLLTAAPKTKLG